MKKLGQCALLLCIFSLFAGSAWGAPLLLYTSQPDEDVQTLIAAFRELHKEIDVQVFRSGTEEVVSKLFAEKMTGRINADVLLLADAVTFERLKAEGVLARYRSGEIDAGENGDVNKIPSFFIDKDEMYCGTKMMATVLFFNTEAFNTEAEGSWRALTDPKNAGKTIIASPLYSGAAAYTLGILTRTEGFGWPYYESMKANGVAVGRGNGSVITAVAGGEKACGLVVDYMAARAKAQGSPVDYVYLAEGSPIITEPVGIVEKVDKNSDLGDARKFVDFVLSEKGQQLVSKQGYVPARGGAPVPDGLKGVDQVKILDFDPTVLVKERENDKTLFTELFGN